MRTSRDGDSPRALLSVVVPCFDEEAFIGETHRRLVAILQTVPELVYRENSGKERCPVQGWNIWMVTSPDPSGRTTFTSLEDSRNFVNVLWPCFLKSKPGSIRRMVS